MTAKIFGIGLSRTGTSSLNAALGVLGFRSVHYPPTPELFRIMHTVDAATDTPVALSFKDLDRGFPGSKFILTVRDREAWLSSCAKLFAGPRPVEEWRLQERRAIYGSLKFDAVRFARAYDRHLARVIEHFIDRPDDLLIMDVKSGWSALCPFLGVPIPRGTKFPHLSFKGVATKKMPPGYSGGFAGPEANRRIA